MVKSDLGQLIDKLEPKTKYELWLLETARTTAELMATIEEQQEVIVALVSKEGR